MRRAQPPCDLSVLWSLYVTAWLQLVLMRPKSGFHPHRDQLTLLCSTARGCTQPLWLGLACGPLGKGTGGQAFPTSSEGLPLPACLPTLQRSRMTCLILSEVFVYLFSEFPSFIPLLVFTKCLLWTKDWDTLLLLPFPGLFIHYKHRPQGWGWGEIGGHEKRNWMELQIFIVFCENTQ